MKTTLKTVVGSLRLLGRRARELSLPGLTTWTFAGERAAVEVSGRIVAESHAAECSARAMAAEAEHVLEDGKVSPAELRWLRGLPARLSRCAERNREISETAVL